MSDAPVVLREMQPSDVLAVADIQLAFFPEYFLCVLGRPIVRLFFGEAVEQEQIAFVTTVDGRVVGFIIGFFRLGAFYRALLRRRPVVLMMAIAPTALRHPGRLVRIVRALLNPGRRTVGPRTATFMFMAVSPGLQRKGVGRLLMEAAIDRAVELGASTAFCQTAKFDNDRTIAFVRAMGFQFVGESVVGQSVRYDCELDLSTARAGITARTQDKE